MVDVCAFTQQMLYRYSNLANHRV